MRHAWIWFAVLSFGGCSCEDDPAANSRDGGDAGHTDGGSHPSDAGPEDAGAEDGGADLGVAPSDQDSGATDAATTGCIDGLDSIELGGPASANLTGAPIAIEIPATGHFTDGHSAALDPARLDWSVSRADDTDPGTISRGEYAPNPSAGGVVHLSATDGCLAGARDLALFLEVRVGQPGTDLTNATTVETDAPDIVYPSDQTRFPRNIYRTLFQWHTAGYSEFRLVFDGPGAKVVVFTDGLHPLCANKTPAAGCWEADERAWQFIAASNAGQTVSFTVEGIEPGPILHRATPIAIGFSKRDVAGAIFYWSTTSAGVRRANIRAAEPENYIAGKPPTAYPDGDKVQCVACHVVSRDGKKMAAPVQAASGQSLWFLDVTKDAPPAPTMKVVANTKGHGFATIAPDDLRAVAAWGGKMWTVEVETGKKIADIALGNRAAGTHPDWSPDDTQLVYATGKGDAPGGASIAVLPRVRDGFGPPAVLVPVAGDRTNLFPMFSPDGRWIAYSQGKGGHDDREAQLFVVRGLVSDPPPKPVELVRANRVVSNRLTDGLHQNSQPTWAPPGDLAWVAFNSMREYGVVLKDGTQQIWVAAIDPAKLGGDEDPSFPAFRLQFQGLEENNHRAFWTLDVRDPPPDGGTSADTGVDAGAPDLGFDAGLEADGGVDPVDGGTCIPRGDPCDVLDDRCCAGLVCDTRNDGESYECVGNI